MHIVVGLLLTIALLYFWLIGHWFARVLVFLAEAVVGFIGDANVPPHNPAGSIICSLIGAALAWPLASIPIYYWRRQIMLEEERIKVLAGGLTPSLPHSLQTASATIKLLAPNTGTCSTGCHPISRSQT
jgi:hypothetical protein